MPYTSPTDPIAGNPITEAWGDAVKAALDYFATLIDDGAWVSHTPTLSQGASGNIAKTIVYSKYKKIGKTCIWTVRVAATAAGTAGSHVELSLPFNMAAGNDIVSASFLMYDASVGQHYFGSAVISSTHRVFGLQNAAATGIGITPNIAVASGDIIHAQVIYETV